MRLGPGSAGAPVRTGAQLPRNPLSLWERAGVRAEAAADTRQSASGPWSVSAAARALTLTLPPGAREPQHAMPLPLEGGGGGP